MGYPDWQGYSQWRGPSFINDELSYPVGNTNRGRYLVNNYASLNIVFEPVPADIGCYINFYDTLTSVDSLSGYGFTASANTGVDVLLPARGNYFEITIVNTGGGSGSAILYVATSNIPVPRPVYNSSGQSILSGFQTLAASGTTTFPLTSISPGQAELWFQPTDATGKLFVNVYALLNNGATQTQFFQFQGPTANSNAMIMIPDAPVIIQVVNSDGGAAHSYRLALIVNQ
jgi:hypothetical protein